MTFYKKRGEIERLYSTKRSRNRGVIFHRKQRGNRPFIFNKTNRNKSVTFYKKQGAIERLHKKKDREIEALHFISQKTKGI